MGENGVATGRLRQLVRLSGELRLQQDLSDELGCSRMRVNRWARGVNLISDEDFARVVSWYARVVFPTTPGVSESRLAAWLRGSYDPAMTDIVRESLRPLTSMGRLRVAAGLTQGDVAEALGIARVTYLGWESDTKHPAYAARMQVVRGVVSRFLPEERDPLAESRDGQEE